MLGRLCTPPRGHHMGHCRMLAPLALAALLAAPSAAFMPAGIPSLRGKSPMLSAQRAKVANRPSFGLRTRQGHGSLLYMLSDEFTVGVLGDLHIDPRKMEDYETGKQQWLPTLNEAKEKHGNVAMVSLGDLGESKSVRPEETNELFAGTTECHKIAAEYLGSFGVPYEVIGGNHDLEGLDEFDTDEANLEMFLRFDSISFGSRRQPSSTLFSFWGRVPDVRLVWQGTQQAEPAVHAPDR